MFDENFVNNVVDSGTKGKALGGKIGDSQANCESIFSGLGHRPIYEMPLCKLVLSAIRALQLRHQQGRNPT